MKHKDPVKIIGPSYSLLKPGRGLICVLGTGKKVE